MALSKKNFTKKTVFVSITRAMAGQVPDIVPGKTTLDDIARGYWYLNLAKANQCEWLIAVNNDVIVGGWKIVSQWRQAFTGATPTRLKLAIDPRRRYCDVKSLPAAAFAPFMNQRMSSIVDIGSMRGPIRYSF